MRNASELHDFASFTRDRFKDLYCSRLQANRNHGTTSDAMGYSYFTHQRIYKFYLNVVQFKDSIKYTQKEKCGHLKSACRTTPRNFKMNSKKMCTHIQHSNGFKISLNPRDNINFHYANAASA